MAADLGKRLLAEIEEVGLDELLHTVHVRATIATEYFGFPPLDRLIQIVTEWRSALKRQRDEPPVVDLMSLEPGGGTTHMLYQLCALAVLPPLLGGKLASAVILDTDNRFSVLRLATQLRLIVQQSNSMSNARTLDEDEISDTISTALKHVHIFRPQSLGSTIATLKSLPEYLFDQTRHNSFERAVQFIAIDSAAAFYWQDRAETEDAAFLASTESSTDPKPEAQPSGYTRLATTLRMACKTFACPAIVTTWYVWPSPPSSYHSSNIFSLRPALLGPWQSLLALHFIVRRVEVRKFPPGISVEEALREVADRREAVDEGKFECSVNEWGLDERILQRLQQVGARFDFTILDQGISMRG